MTTPVRLVIAVLLAGFAVVLLIEDSPWLGPVVYRATYEHGLHLADVVILAGCGSPP